MTSLFRRATVIIFLASCTARQPPDPRLFATVRQDLTDETASSAAMPTCVTIQRQGSSGTVYDALILSASTTGGEGPDANFGASNSLAGGNVAGGTLRHALIRFDLSSIPAGASVTSASVTLTDLIPGLYPPLPEGVHQITSPWSEATVTWNNFANAYQPTPFTTLEPTSSTSEGADITALVQAWLSNPSANDGLLLEHDTSLGAVVFASSEVPSVNERPELEVCYLPCTCAAPGQCKQAGSCHSDGTCSFADADDGSQCTVVPSRPAGGTCQQGTCVDPIEAWRKSMARSPGTNAGCFEASYPSTTWSEVPCAATEANPPIALYGPGRATGAAKGDIAPEVSSGSLTWAEGSFPFAAADYASNCITPPVVNYYSLQLNSNTFDTPLCAGASPPPGQTCMGWEQFVYDGGGDVTIETWLLNYNNNTSQCPPGWTPQDGTDCLVAMSASATALGTADLGSVEVTATAGTYDTITVPSVMGNSLVRVSEASPVGLSTAWNTAEFNVFGQQLGWNLCLDPTSTVVVQTLTSSAPLTRTEPAVQTNSTTAESNDLPILMSSICTFEGDTPGVQFVEGTAPMSPPACPTLTLSPNPVVVPAGGSASSAVGISGNLWGQTNNAALLPLTCQVVGSLPAGLDLTVDPAQLSAGIGPTLVYAASPGSAAGTVTVNLLCDNGQSITQHVSIVAPAPTCSGMVCAGLCADTHSDPDNCGTCGAVCPTGYSCQSGDCALACSTGQTVCNGACSNLQLDVNNCGTCGTVCQSGTSCWEGQCETQVLAQQGQPHGLAVDATNVYWIDAAGVYMVRKDGSSHGVVTNIASSGGDSVVVDASDVTNATTAFWTDGFNIYSAPVTGPLVGLELNAYPNTDPGFDKHDVKTDGVNVYWADSHGVWSLPVDGGPLAHPFAPMNPGITDGFAINPTLALGFVDEVEGSRISSFPLGGGTSTVVIPIQGSTPIAASATNVFFVTKSNTPSGLTSTIESPMGTVSYYPYVVGVQQIATDGVNVYWTAIPVGPPPNAVPGVYRAQHFIGEPPVLFATAQHPGGLAVDTGAVYWTEMDTGLVMKRITAP